MSSGILSEVEQRLSDLLWAENIAVNILCFFTGYSTQFRSKNDTSYKDNTILRFADDTTVIGLISGGDETAYRREVASLVKWCDSNNLSLNTDKTKEMVLDLRRERRQHQPLIRDSELVKKAHQRLYFLRRLRKFGMSQRTQRTFYTAVIESILTSCITVWYGNSTAADRKRLQRAVRMAERIVWEPLPSLQDIYHHRVHRRACRIITDPSHPQHTLFSPSALWQEAAGVGLVPAPVSCVWVSGWLRSQLGHNKFCAWFGWRGWQPGYPGVVLEVPSCEATSPGMTHNSVPLSSCQSRLTEASAGHVAQRVTPSDGEFEMPQGHDTFTGFTVLSGLEKYTCRGREERHSVFVPRPKRKSHCP
ncbi:hypothetical protein L3Q82_002006 [Scortum barcoo]|uniref:Uncharacterized protein n=1 Tax=Scortum barcoo TaxID=214431 RepID=A0ACB8W1Q5_9TELE|nr:hypothetical protein L3Q82_002006 [Scortum barcoo]